MHCHRNYVTGTKCTVTGTHRNEATDATGTVIIPNVGDFVSIDKSADGGKRSSFHGKVRSRLFSYIRTHNEMFCYVKIIVEETDDDWGKLIKE